MTYSADWFEAGVHSAVPSKPPPAKDRRHARSRPPPTITPIPRARHRLGRHFHPRGPSARRRHQHHHLPSSSNMRIDRISIARDPTTRSTGAEDDRAVEGSSLDRLGGDVRGGRGTLLADVLHGPATTCWRRAASYGDADDHNAAFDLISGHPPAVRLDPQVHLPRRLDPVDGGDRRIAVAAGSALRVQRHDDKSAATTPARWRSGVSASSPTPTRRWRRWDSPTSSGGCGSSTWPTARRVSPPKCSVTAQILLSRASR